MLERMPLKRVWGAVQRSENAKKKRSAEWALLMLKRVLNRLDEKNNVLSDIYLICSAEG